MLLPEKRKEARRTEEFSQRESSSVDRTGSKWLASAKKSNDWALKVPSISDSVTCETATIIIIIIIRLIISSNTVLHVILSSYIHQSYKINHIKRRIEVNEVSLSSAARKSPLRLYTLHLPYLCCSLVVFINIKGIARMVRIHFCALKRGTQ